MGEKPIYEFRTRPHWRFESIGSLSMILITVALFLFFFLREGEPPIVLLFVLLGIAVMMSHSFLFTFLPIKLYEHKIIIPSGFYSYSLDSSKIVRIIEYKNGHKKNKNEKQDVIIHNNCNYDGWHIHVHTKKNDKNFYFVENEISENHTNQRKQELRQILTVLKGMIGKRWKDVYERR